MLTNLLKETKYVMEQEKLSSEDIVFMGYFKHKSYQ